MIKHLYDLLWILLKQNAKTQIKRQKSKLLIYDVYLKKYVSADELLIPCPTKDCTNGTDLWKKSKDYILFELLMKKFINPKLDLLGPSGINSKIFDHNTQGYRYSSTIKDFWERGTGNKTLALPLTNNVEEELDENVVGWAGQAIGKPRSNPKPEQSTSSLSLGSGGNPDKNRNNRKDKRATGTNKTKRYDHNLAKNGALLYEGKTERKKKGTPAKILKQQTDLPLQNKSKSKLWARKSAVKYNIFNKSINDLKEPEKNSTDTIKSQSIKKEKDTLFKKICYHMFSFGKPDGTDNGGNITKVPKLQEKDTVSKNEANDSKSTNLDAKRKMSTNKLADAGKAHNKDTETLKVFEKEKSVAKNNSSQSKLANNFKKLEQDWMNDSKNHVEQNNSERKQVESQKDFLEEVTPTYKNKKAKDNNSEEIKMPKYIKEQNTITLDLASSMNKENEINKGTENTVINIKTHSPQKINYQNVKSKNNQNTSKNELRLESPKGLDITNNTSTTMKNEKMNSDKTVNKSVATNDNNSLSKGKISSLFGNESRLKISSKQTSFPGIENKTISQDKLRTANKAINTAATPSKFKAKNAIFSSEYNSDSQVKFQNNSQIQTPISSENKTTKTGNLGPDFNSDRKIDPQIKSTEAPKRSSLTNVTDAKTIGSSVNQVQQLPTSRSELKRGTTKKNSSNSNKVHSTESEMALKHEKGVVLETHTKESLVAQRNTESDNQKNKDEVNTEKSPSIEATATEKLHEISAQGKLFEDLDLNGELHHYNIKNYRGFKILNSQSGKEGRNKNLVENTTLKKDLEINNSKQGIRDKRLTKSNDSCTYTDLKSGALSETKKQVTENRGFPEKKPLFSETPKDVNSNKTITDIKNLNDQVPVISKLSTNQSLKTECAGMKKEVSKYLTLNKNTAIESVMETKSINKENTSKNSTSKSNRQLKEQTNHVIKAPSNQNPKTECTEVKKVKSKHLTSNKNSVTESEMGTKSMIKENTFENNTSKSKTQLTEKTYQATEKNVPLLPSAKNKVDKRIKYRLNKRKFIKPKTFKYTLKKARKVKAFKQQEKTKNINDTEKNQSIPTELKNNQLIAQDNSINKSISFHEKTQSVNNNRKMNEQVQRSKSVQVLSRKRTASAKKGGKEHLNMKSKSMEALLSSKTVHAGKQTNASSWKMKEPQKQKSKISNRTLTSEDKNPYYESQDAQNNLRQGKIIKKRSLPSVNQSHLKKTPNKSPSDISNANKISRGNNKGREDLSKGGKSVKSKSLERAEPLINKSTKRSHSVKNNKSSRTFNPKTSNSFSKRTLARDTSQKVKGIQSSPELSNNIKLNYNKDGLVSDVGSVLKSAKSISNSKKSQGSKVNLAVEKQKSNKKLLERPPKMSRSKSESRTKTIINPGELKQPSKSKHPGKNQLTLSKSKTSLDSEINKNVLKPKNRKPFSTNYGIQSEDTENKAKRIVKTIKNRNENIKTKPLPNSLKLVKTTEPIKSTDKYEGEPNEEINPQVKTRSSINYVKEKRKNNSQEIMSRKNIPLNKVIYDKKNVTIIKGKESIRNLNEVKSYLQSQNSNKDFTGTLNTASNSVAKNKSKTERFLKINVTRGTKKVDKNSRTETLTGKIKSTQESPVPLKNINEPSLKKDKTVKYNKNNKESASDPVLQKTNNDVTKKAIACDEDLRNLEKNTKVESTENINNVSHRLRNSSTVKNKKLCDDSKDNVIMSDSQRLNNKTEVKNKTTILQNTQKAVNSTKNSNTVMQSDKENRLKPLSSTMHVTNSEKTDNKESNSERSSLQIQSSIKPKVDLCVKQSTNTPKTTHNQPSNVGKTNLLLNTTNKSEITQKTVSNEPTRRKEQEVLKSTKQTGVDWGAHKESRGDSTEGLDSTKMTESSKADQKEHRSGERNTPVALNRKNQSGVSTPKTPHAEQNTIEGNVTQGLNGSKQPKNKPEAPLTKNLSNEKTTPKLINNTRKTVAIPKSLDISKKPLHSQKNKTITLAETNRKGKDLSNLHINSAGSRQPSKNLNNDDRAENVNTNKGSFKSQDSMKMKTKEQNMKRAQSLTHLTESKNENTQNIVDLTSHNDKNKTIPKHEFRTVKNKSENSVILQNGNGANENLNNTFSAENQHLRKIMSKNSLKRDANNGVGSVKDKQIYTRDSKLSAETSDKSNFESRPPTETELNQGENNLKTVNNNKNIMYNNFSTEQSNAAKHNLKEKETSRIIVRNQNKPNEYKNNIEKHTNPLEMNSAGLSSRKEVECNKVHITTEQSSLIKEKVHVSPETRTKLSPLSNNMLPTELSIKDARCSTLIANHISEKKNTSLNESEKERKTTINHLQRSNKVEKKQHTIPICDTARENNNNTDNLGKIGNPEPNISHETDKITKINNISNNKIKEYNHENLRISLINSKTQREEKNKNEPGTIPLQTDKENNRIMFLQKAQSVIKRETDKPASSSLDVKHKNNKSDLQLTTFKEDSRLVKLSKMFCQQKALNKEDDIMELDKITKETKEKEDQKNKYNLKLISNKGESSAIRKNINSLNKNNLLNLMAKTKRQSGNEKSDGNPSKHDDSQFKNNQEHSVPFKENSERNGPTLMKKERKDGGSLK